jgi:hypothetical protein
MLAWHMNPKKLFPLFFFLSVSVVLANPIPPLAGTYSTLKYIAGESDVVGLEVTMIPSGTEGHYAYHAVVQTAEGVPTPPQLVTVKFDGTKLVFTFAYAHVFHVTFTGKIQDKVLVGKLTGPHFSETECILPRKEGFWLSPLPATPSDEHRN